MRNCVGKMKRLTIHIDHGEQRRHIVEDELAPLTYCGAELHRFRSITNSLEKHVPGTSTARGSSEGGNLYLFSWGAILNVALGGDPTAIRARHKLEPD